MSLLAQVIASSRRRAFTPLSLSPEMWLDASDASTLFDATSGGSLVAADGQVARWEDKSVNARHATNAIGGQRPLRKLAIQNGKDCVRFDGTDDWLTFSFGTPTAYTIVAVYSHLSAQTSYRGVIGIGGGGTGTMMLERLDANPTKWGSFASGEVPSTAVKPTGFAVRTMTEAKTPEVKLYVNNVFDSTHAVYTVGQGTNHLGGLAPGQETNMDLAEILVFGRVLNGTELTNLHTYLFAKWGITP